MWTSTKRWRNSGSSCGRAGGEVADRRDRRRPEPPAIATRSLASVVTAAVQPAADLADHVVGGDADVVEEHLVEVGVAGHLAERADVDARRSHVDDEVGDALVLGRRRGRCGR